MKSYGRGLKLPDECKDPVNKLRLKIYLAIVSIVTLTALGILAIVFNLNGKLAFYIVTLIAGLGGYSFRILTERRDKNRG